MLNTPEISSLLFANTAAVLLLPAKGHIGLLITNYVWYNQLHLALILHSPESIFLHMFIFSISLLGSTLEEFIDINSRKISMIYT